MAVNFPAMSCNFKSPSMVSKPQFKHPIHKPKTQDPSAPSAVPLLISSLKACKRLSELREGRTIHAVIIKSGLGPNQFLAASLIDLYSIAGQLNLARQVFDHTLEKDATLHTALLVGYARNDNVESARSVFDAMPERDVVAWNAMLSSYTHSGLANNALKLFRSMQIAEVRPNEVTLVNALAACSQLGCLAFGEWIRAYIDNEAGIKRTSTLCNSLMNMYAKCGRLDAALNLFLDEWTRNLESWNTMLTAFAIHGHGDSAMSLFSQIIKIGLVPDKISFICALMACSHSGKVDHAVRCFTCMSLVYGVEPSSAHYGCMVDVLSRAGLLEAAQLLMHSMPFEPDACILGALLRGCLTHHNYDLGLWAANRLIVLEPHVEDRYIALVNLYVMANRFEDAMRVRKMMVGKGMKGSSGSSLIEVNGRVHEFTAGDRSHHRSKDIYSMIEKIGVDLHSHDSGSTGSKLP